MSAKRRRPPRQPTGPVPKTAAELDAMAAAGVALAECVELLRDEVRAGISTLEVDRIAEEAIRSRGAIPAFLGYPGGASVPPFPGTICASLNDEVVHGIPGPVRLRDGDIFSVDIGLVLDGWVADTARTFPIGSITADAARLISVTETALARGIEQARPGRHVGDIGHAVQTEVEAAGYAVVRALVGHGVGRTMHEEPQVPNFGEPGTGPLLEPGIVIAIEPMVNAGGADITIDTDGWTIRTADGSLSAHAEHTVAVTENGPRILTQRAG
jgi:methionyl aminopeptidase